VPLEARNVYFRYSRSLPWVIEDRTIVFEKGRRTAIFAPSGYGKTTLAMLLSGYITPTKGSILLDGRPLPTRGICPVQLISQHPEKAVDPRRRMKYVLEEGGEYDDSLLEIFGIEKAWLDRFPRELSGGELQRFCAARALLSGAEYLICDEISTMLDVITQAQIWNVILSEAERRNMGLIIITHDMKLAERVSDEIIEWGNERERD